MNNYNIFGVLPIDNLKYISEFLHAKQVNKWRLVSKKISSVLPPVRDAKRITEANYLTLMNVFTNISIRQIVIERLDIALMTQLVLKFQPRNVWVCY